jgi:hypothetical protein
MTELEENLIEKYRAMRHVGLKPVEVYQLAKAEGLDFIACIRLLRDVFALNLVEAKEVAVIGDGSANSLAEYQERFVEPLRQVLEAIKQEEDEES